jgi:hypothetical protein
MTKIILGGIYKHFKGGMYKVIDVVKHSETLKDLVYYIKLDNGTSWARPIEMFLETITREGKTFQRFELVNNK